MIQSTTSSGYGTATSAFVKYRKPSPPPRKLLPEKVKENGMGPSVAPLADEENSSIGSATSEDKKAFEYRIGLIMNNLEEQAQNLLRIAEGYD